MASTDQGFVVLFESVRQLEADETSQVLITTAADIAASNEIAELQRLCAALSEPPATYYTGT